MSPDVFILPRNYLSYIHLFSKKKLMLHSSLAYMQLNQISPTAIVVRAIENYRKSDTDKKPLTNLQNSYKN